MGLLFLPPWPTRTGLCPLLPLLLPLRKKRALVFLFLLEKLALLVVSRHIIMKDVHRESHTYTKTHTGRWFGRLVWLIGLDQRLKKSQRQVSPSNTRQSYQNELFSGRESFRVLFLEECAKWPAKTRHAWNTSSSSTDSPFQQILTKICSFPWTRRAHTQPSLLCWLLF